MLKQLQMDRGLLWNRVMSIAEFFVPDNVEAINDELHARDIDPDQVVAIFHLPSTTDAFRVVDMGGRFRVLYRA